MTTLRWIVRRRVAVVAIALCLPLIILWACSEFADCQIATVGPINAQGVILAKGKLSFYSAAHYQGVFPRTGLLVTGPVDIVLDRSSAWSLHYHFAVLTLENGYSYLGEHGIAWDFFTIPVGTVGTILCLYPLSMWVDGLIRRSRQHQKRLQSQHYCKVCRYDLTGNLSGVCPECGTRAQHNPLR